MIRTGNSDRDQSVGLELTKLFPQGPFKQVVPPNRVLPAQYFPCLHQWHGLHLHR